MKIDIPKTLEEWNAKGADYLPGHLGISFDRIGRDGVEARLVVARRHMAWNGFLHAGTIITMADTCCGYGTVANLPDGARGFTTVELKSNHLGTAREGVVECTATPSHIGRTTQVWDAVVKHKDTGKTMALFRCTQIILYK